MSLQNVPDTCLFPHVVYLLFIYDIPYVVMNVACIFVMEIKHLQ